MVEKYRTLPLTARQLVHTVLDGLSDLRQEWQQVAPEEDIRTIPLYASPAAAGFAAPVFQEDYDLIPVTGDVPAGAELAVRMRAAIKRNANHECDGCGEAALGRLRFRYTRRGNQFFVSEIWIMEEEQ